MSATVLPPSDNSTGSPPTFVVPTLPSVKPKKKENKKKSSTLRHKGSKKEKKRYLSKGDVSRLMRRSGVKCSGRECYEGAEDALRIYLKNILRHVTTLSDYQRTRTVKLTDVRRACTYEYGQTLYGVGE